MRLFCRSALFGFAQGLSLGLHPSNNTEFLSLRALRSAKACGSKESVLLFAYPGFRDPVNREHPQSPCSLHPGLLLSTLSNRNIGAPWYAVPSALCLTDGAACRSDST